LRAKEKKDVFDFCDGWDDDDVVVVLILYLDGSAAVFVSGFVLRAAEDVLVLPFSFFERFRLGFSSTGLL